MVPSLPDTSKRKAHSRLPECDGRPSARVQPGPVNRKVTASAGVHKEWFTPHVDLFATRLNHKVPLYVSPVLDQHA